MVELVYTHDLKSCRESGAGSIPAPGTKIVDVVCVAYIIYYFVFGWESKDGAGIQDDNYTEECLKVLKQCLYIVLKGGSS